MNSDNILSIVSWPTLTVVIFSNLRPIYIDEKEEGIKRGCIALHVKPISELRSITCHTGSHSASKREIFLSENVNKRKWAGLSKRSVALLRAKSDRSERSDRRKRMRSILIFWAVKKNGKFLLRSIRAIWSGKKNATIIDPASLFELKKWMYGLIRCYVHVQFTGCNVQAELCCRVEEAMCLRAMVSQLREQLDAEKLLNAAIKEKKVLLSVVIALQRNSLRYYYHQIVLPSPSLKPISQVWICDSTTIRLRHDYDEKLRCSFLLASNWKQVRTIRRSRIVVLS